MLGPFTATEWATFAGLIIRAGAFLVPFVLPFFGS